MAAASRFMKERSHEEEGGLQDSGDLDNGNETQETEEYVESVPARSRRAKPKHVEVSGVGSVGVIDVPVGGGGGGGGDEDAAPSARAMDELLEEEYEELPTYHGSQDKELLLGISEPIVIPITCGKEPDEQRRALIRPLVDINHQDRGRSTSTLWAQGGVIQYGNKMLKGQQFEAICGRGTAKKWKHSCEVADGVAGCLVSFKRQRVEACLVNMGGVHGESLIGQRVQVYRVDSEPPGWSAKGSVVAFEKETGEHIIKYDGGALKDRRHLANQKMRWWGRGVPSEARGDTVSMAASSMRFAPCRDCDACLINAALPADSDQDARLACYRAMVRRGVELGFHGAVLADQRDGLEGEKLSLELAYPHGTIAERNAKVTVLGFDARQFAHKVQFSTGEEDYVQLWQPQLNQRTEVPLLCTPRLKSGEVVTGVVPPSGRGGTRRSRTAAAALRNAEAAAAAAAAQRDSMPLADENEGMHAAVALTDFANAVAAQEEEPEDAPPSRRARSQHHAAAAAALAPLAMPPPALRPPRASALSSDLKDDAQVDLYSVLLSLGEHFAAPADAEAAAAQEAERLQECIVDFFTFANRHAPDLTFEGQYKVVKYLYQQTPPNWAQLKRHVMRTCALQRVPEPPAPPAPPR